MVREGARMLSWLGLVVVLAGSAARADSRHSGPDHGGDTSFVYTALNDLPHGIAADERLVFIALPLAGKVSVLDRFTGSEIAELPAPAGGFGLPFVVRVPRPGHLVLLDSGGFPSPVSPSIPSVDDYSYSYDARTRQFSATLERSVRFDGLPVIFAEDVEVVSPDLYVVSESVIGGLWLVHGDGSITPGIFPDNPAVPLPALGGCGMPAITIGNVPFDPGFAPGINSLAKRGDQLYFTSSCLGGLYKVPVATLLDQSRTPGARASDIQTVSARPAGTLEALEGLAFPTGEPTDRWAYVGDPFHLRVIRIDVETGAREVVGDDPTLFNFPVGLTWLPTLFGTRELLVTSDQEYRLAGLNPALSQDELQPPFLVTAVVPNEACLGH
ncbi:MAG: hypothetical protein JST54_01835 [Deltaproteobacteria bacterium]|nr:hypothetical protein [Deltaproteobacteria bacterium]